MLSPALAARHIYCTRMLHLARQIDEAKAAIRKHWDRPARVGIILGSGLGDLANDIRAEATLPYEQVPHFPRSTVIGHAGRLV